MTNLLLCKPPTTVYIGGVETPIIYDYRAAVRFEMLITSGCEDVYELLRCFYAEIPADIEGALKAAIRFYALGKEYGDSGESGAKEPCYSFAQDSAELIASFRAAYGIDLTTAGLHWWLFRTLMLQLPDDSAFKKVVQIRTADTSDMGDKQRKRVEKLKRLYAIGADEQKHETLAERNARWKKAGW